MAYRASPPRRVDAWTKVALAAAEANPVTVAEFVNLEASHVTHEGGFSQGVYALFPDKHDYDRLRILFSMPVLVDILDATITLWGRQGTGPVYVLGTSQLRGDGTFPAIEVENYQALYAVTVSFLDPGALPALSVQAFVQGVHQGYIQ
jgi:hypothetical protein